MTVSSVIHEVTWKEGQEDGEWRTEDGGCEGEEREANDSSGGSKKASEWKKEKTRKRKRKKEKERDSLPINVILVFVSLAFLLDSCITARKVTKPGQIPLGVTHSLPVSLLACGAVDCIAWHWIQSTLRLKGRQLARNGQSAKWLREIERERGRGRGRGGKRKWKLFLLRLLLWHLIRLLPLLLLLQQLNHTLPKFHWHLPYSCFPHFSLCSPCVCVCVCLCTVTFSLLLRHGLSYLSWVELSRLVLLLPSIFASASVVMCVCWVNWRDCIH